MNTQESADTRIVDPAPLPFAYQDALNAGDADAVVALFHQDATMRTFAGSADGSWRFAILDCQGAVGSPGWS